MRKITLILLFVLMVVLVGLVEAGQGYIVYEAGVFVESRLEGTYIVIEEIPADTFLIVPDVIVIGGVKHKILQEDPI